MEIREILKALKKAMTSEINEGEYYVLNNKNRSACSDEEGIAFTDQVGSETVVSFKSESQAEKFISDNFSKTEIKEESIRAVLESDVCSYGYFVNEKNEVTPVYTLNTLLNRATNERYHKNINDAQYFVDDAPNRTKKKEAKKTMSEAQRLKKKASDKGMTIVQYLKELGLA